MLRNCHLFVAFFLLLLHTPAYEQSPFVHTSQSPPFHHLTYADGLLGYNVTTMAQDASGFMWFGFGNGLQRYDGEKFLTYPFKVVTFLQPLPSSPLLTALMTDGSLQSFNPKNGSLTRLAPDSSKSIWYTDAGGKQWRLYNRYQEPLAGNKTICQGMAYLQWPNGACIGVRIFTDNSRKQTWVQGGTSGLILLDEVSGKVYEPGSGNGTALFGLLKQAAEWARGITLDVNYNLWIFTWTDLFLRYDTRQNKLHSYYIADLLQAAGEKRITGGFVNDILCDRQRNVWIATSKAGLLRYNPVTDKLTVIRADGENSRGLHYSFDVSRLYQDREDNIWIATDKGINHFNPYHQPFTLIRHEAGAASLPNGEITDVAETDKGDLLVATWGSGIGVYNQRKQHVRNWDFGDLHHNQVWCFAKRENGIMAAGCQYGVIHLLQPDGSVRTWQPPALERSTIRFMVNDRAGNTWIGLHSGKIALWRAGAEDVTVYNTNGNLLPPHTAYINNLFLDKTEKLWLATARGLKQFDPLKQTVSVNYQPLVDGIPKTVKKECYAVEELNDSLLLVGFENIGLYIFNRDKKRFTTVKINNETRPQTVYAIRKDGKGIIWISTAHELFQWDMAEQKFIPSSPSRYMLNSLFFINRIYPLRSGEWVSFTQSEVIFFHPAQQQKELLSREPVTITGFDLFGKTLPIDSLLENYGRIELAHKQNFFSVGFALLRFTNAHRIKYQYRLKGLDDHWIAAGNRRSAHYTAVPPGFYQFEVRQEGSQLTTSLPIFIKAAFWQTALFQVLIGLLGVGLIAGFVSWRIATVKQQARLKHQIAETEMAALRAQMNPHFIFNCINSIDALIQRNDKYNATMYLNKFAKLIRNILDSSKQNIVPLTKDLETLRLYIELEQLRNENKFVAEVSADALLLQDDYRVPPLIVQPYVENAIQHGLRHRPGNDGKLRVHVVRENGSLVYSIEDNGVGRTSAAMAVTDRSHYGLQMSSDRVKLFNEEEDASVSITDLEEGGKPAGTRVKVWLRVK
jgi:ligand-binding sensor domain-containing protein/anti-sigma regulatory factor (Ser/Thr protein kinase)